MRERMNTRRRCSIRSYSCFSVLMAVASKAAVSPSLSHILSLLLSLVFPSSLSSSLTQSKGEEEEDGKRIRDKERERMKVIRL